MREELKLRQLDLCDGLCRVEECDGKAVAIWWSEHPHVGLVRICAEHRDWMLERGYKAVAFAEALPGGKREGRAR